MYVQYGESQKEKKKNCGAYGRIDIFYLFPMHKFTLISGVI